MTIDNMAGRGRMFLFVLFAACNIMSVAAEMIADTQNSSYQSASEYIPCEMMLPVSEEAKDAFRVALTEENVFVYVKLDLNLEQVYGGINDFLVINPFVWVWALEGKGYALLSYPYDFEYISLGTLSPGVGRVNFTVALSEAERQCFLAASDGNRQNILSRLVTDVADEANRTLNKSDTEMYHGENFQVCLEEKNMNRHYFAYAFLYDYETLYNCTTFTDDEAIYKVIEKHSWPLVVNCAIMFIACIFPLGISFFLSKHPPIKLDGHVYLAVDANLPVGIKHFLFHSNSGCKWIVAIRAFLAPVLFTLIGTLPYTVPFAYKDEYELRKKAALLPPLASYHIIVMSVIIFFCLLGIIVYLLDTKKMVGIFDKVLEEEESEMMYLDVMTKGFRLSESDLKRIPNLEGSYFHKVKQILYFYAHHLIRPQVWWSAVSLKIKYFVVRIIVFPLLTLWFLLCNLPIVRFWSMSSRVFLYLLERVLGKAKVVAPLVKVILTPVFTPATSFNIAFFLLFLGELILYTFTGLLLNYDQYGGEKYAYAVAGIGTFIGSINFYGKYCSLHRTVLEVACELDAENSGTTDAYSRVDSRAPKGNDGTPQEDQNHGGHPGKKYVTYINGIPHISLDLFKACCKRFQPVLAEVINLSVLMMCIILVVLFAMSTLNTIQEEVELPAVLSNFLVPLFSIGIIPFLKSITTSTEEEKCKDKAKLLNIKQFLMEYSPCGHEQEDHAGTSSDSSSDVNIINA